ncbi:MAG TPA: lysine transporter LysE [Deltaproteobacteria bacterium]|nr:lysine transporter LysE [Deltaproteobacteria bacterium]
MFRRRSRETAERVRIYWIGLLVGLSIAAPLGPVNVVCIRRTLSGGFVLGFVSGCGAALADTFYGVVATFGISVVASFLLAHEKVLRLGGGLVLCLLGARSFRGDAEGPHSAVGAQGLVSAFVSTFLLTLTNPLVLLTIAAVSAALGLAAEELRGPAAATVVLGVLSGSLLWWLVLLGGVGLARARFHERMLRWVYLASGGLLFAAGVALLASLAFSL